jgi:hypothetical protein
MAGQKCSPPKGQSVRAHTRSARRKKAKPAAAKAGATYWVVRNERTGATTGTKHRSYSSAINARARKDRISFRAGGGRPWNVEKRTG